jgi:hypothetical protein
MASNVELPAVTRTNSQRPDGGRRKSRYRGRIALLVACILALAVVAGCGPENLVFSPLTLPDAQTGSAYTATITVSQARTPVGGAGISDGALPAGLDLELSDAHDNTIHISGTPTASGTSTSPSQCGASARRSAANPAPRNTRSW